MRLMAEVWGAVHWLADKRCQAGPEDFKLRFERAGPDREPTGEELKARQREVSERWKGFFAATQVRKPEG